MAALRRRSLALLLPLLLAGPVQGLSDEDRLRAAFVLRLTQYTQWPTPPQAGRLPLCLAGLARGVAALQALDLRPIGDALLQVRTVATPRDAVAAQCRVLLLGHGDAATLRRWIDEIGDAAILVMGTSPEAWRAGVTIALLSEPQGMAFAVDHGEARRRGLQLAPPVLKLAREVR